MLTSNVRTKYYHVDTIKHLFNDVPIDNIFLFLKDINLFNKLNLIFTIINYILICVTAVTTVQAKSIYEPRHEISNNVVCATSKASDQPAHTRSLIRAFASRLHIL